MYFSDINNTDLNYKKSSAKDKSGNLVQNTYYITSNNTQCYTINAYLTKCSLLVNGKNTQQFIDRDIPLIHNIMSETKFNGLSLNIEQLNHSLRLKLEKALSEMNKPVSSINSLDCNDHIEKHKEEKCYKCKRKCKTRAAFCINEHWVHYICDKLS